MRFLCRVVFFTVSVFTFASCGQTRFDNEGMTVFRYNEASNITSLDPIYARNQANIWATSQIFNSLLQLDTNLNVVPALARAYEVSEDGLVYTFHLRNDVYFHDNPVFAGGKGRRVVASDFVFSFSRLIDPSLTSPGLWVMNSVARKANDSLDISALSDTTLVIRLQSPFPPFAGLLTMQYCAVVPHEAVARYGQEFRRNPVGTGPFRFKYWKEGVKLVLRRNENYFEFDGDQRLPFLDAVAITFIIDRQTAFLELIMGNLDFLSGIHASYKDEILTPDGQLQPEYSNRFKLISMPFLNKEYLGINVCDQSLPDDWPLREVKVRQAINYGFDRHKMIRFLRNNIGVPAEGGFVPTGMPGFYENAGGYSYDPDRARELLAEAGFPHGEGLPRITLQTNQLHADIAQFLQHELAKIGIRLSIDVLPPATLREMMAKGEAQIFRASWIADYPDAENYLALFYSKNHAPAGPNFTRFSNQQFDELYEKAMTITDDRARHILYHQMNQIIIEQAPVVFLYYDRSVRFVARHVEGLSNNPLNHLDLRRVRINRQ
ncbi:MAG TPA: ABC transporter substrate-binding protein [Bacteroidales bacterium]|nr:ABC transporter substrate-binding protein [Bacteroidales bacterium]